MLDWLLASMAQEESNRDLQPATATDLTAFKGLSRRIILLASTTAALVVMLGWTTGLRDWLHTSLITVCVFALFPFLVVCALLAAFTLFAFACALIAASVGADDILPDAFTAHAVDGLWGVSGGIRIYYRWLARHRKSAWLGLPVGLLLGGLLLWVALAIFVIPREAATMARLRGAQILIEDNYKRRGGYPSPDDREAFLVPASAAEAFSDALSADSHLLDAFGQPVEYVVKGHGILASYRLRSLGFDRVRSDDDLCTSGQTRLRQAVDVALLVNDLVSLAKLEKKSWHSRFEDIYAASCLR